MGFNVLVLARPSKRPGSVWNCLWGHALKRSPGINRKSRVSYPGPGFLSSATWPLLPKKHYNGLNQIKPNLVSVATWMKCASDTLWIPLFVWVRLYDIDSVSCMAALPTHRYGIMTGHIPCISYANLECVT